jgi:hypothetical protein
MKLKCVLVCISYVLAACGGDPGNTTPAVGTINFIADESTFPVDINSQKINIGWSKPAGNSIQDEYLEYKVLFSESNDVSTLLGVERNAKTVMEWKRNVNEYLLDGLLEDKLYYITVLVRNDSGGVSVYPPLSHHTVFRLSIKGEGVSRQFKNLLPSKGSIDAIDFSSTQAVGAGGNLPKDITSAKILKEDSIVGSTEKLWALFKDGQFIKGVQLELDRSDDGGLKTRQIAAKYKELSPMDNAENIMKNWISLNLTNQLTPFAMSEGDVSKEGYGISNIVFYSAKRLN